MEGLTVGRIVHFVMPEGRDWVDVDGKLMAGQHYPAIIVALSSGYTENCVNLHVFHNAPSCGVETNVTYSEEKKPGTWHWIERT